MIWQCFRFCLSFQTSAEGELLICEGKTRAEKLLGISNRTVLSINSENY